MATNERTTDNGIERVERRPRGDVVGRLRARHLQLLPDGVAKAQHRGGQRRGSRADEVIGQTQPVQERNLS